MSKARQLADLLDSNGDVVVGALDNAPDPDLTPYVQSSALFDEGGDVKAELLDNAPNPIRVETTNPAITTNSGEVGDLWLNKTTGELYMLLDATTDENEWINIGDGTGAVTNRGLVSGNPASSAKELFDLGYTTNGTFYISNDFTGNVPVLTYCRFNVQRAGSGNYYHVQKFYPPHMSGYNFYASGGGAGNTSWTNITSDLTDATTYNTRYETYSSGQGVCGTINTTVPISSIGQIFLMIDRNMVSNGDGGNATGESGFEVSSDGIGHADSGAANGYSYSHNWQSLPNQALYSTAGFLLPPNAGVSTFPMDSITASYGSASGSLDGARGSFEGGGVSISANTSYDVTTSRYFAMIAQGWSDTGNIARSQYMYWVAAEV